MSLGNMVNTRWLEAEENREDACHGSPRETKEPGSHPQEKERGSPLETGKHGSPGNIGSLLGSDSLQPSSEICILKTEKASPGFFLYIIIFAFASPC